MKCAVCKSADHRVLETVERESAIRRRRKCERCGHRWSTFERDEGSIVQIDTQALLTNVRSLEALIVGAG